MFNVLTLITDYVTIITVPSTPNRYDLYLWINPVSPWKEL